jgi:dihydrofolate synthase/folylpolyglutamate synthase
LLDEVLDAADGLGASFFEVTTAAALLAFSRSPAAACILEVGLGGRLDATNVVPTPVACGIAALGIDHVSFLGDTIAQIAAEKAGISRAGVPIATLAYVAEAEASIDGQIGRTGALRLKLGQSWHLAEDVYRDRYGAIRLPLLGLAGGHQQLNAGLALAMLRHQRAVAIDEAALVQGLASANWPGRMQRLANGPLVGDREAWLDGGHNPSAAAALAEAFAGRKLDIVVGMLANKDAAEFLTLLAPVARSVIAVPVPGHEHHAPEALCALVRGLGLPASPAPDLIQALQLSEAPVLITGSLYLAGEVLRLNGELPQ